MREKKTHLGNPHRNVLGILFQSSDAKPTEYDD